MDTNTFLVAAGEPVNLRDVIEEIVRRVIREEVPMAVEQGTIKPYLTKRELKDLTGWSDRQVEYKKSKGEIPYIRRGRLVLFPTQEIFVYLEAGRVPAKRSPRKGTS